MRYGTVSWYILTLAVHVQKTEAVNCLTCDDEASPAYCRDTIICGQGEICFTREYVDIKNRQAFHMGCEDRARCDLFKSPLFGRRSLDDVQPNTYAHVPARMCYDCCESTECNSRLCLDALPTTTPIPTAGFPGCPVHFHRFESACYLFAPGVAAWTTARDYCRSFGANLLSLTSNPEHDFIKQNMLTLNASFTGNFWTGGFYSHAAGEWEWEDRTPFTYSFWYPGQPPASLNQTSNYYIAMGNPAYSTTYYKDAPFWVDSPDRDGEHDYGIICKLTP